MAISFTFHTARAAENETGETLQALKKPTGARVDVADAAVSSALATSGLYRIVASTTSYVLISSAATNGTGGFHLPAGSDIVMRIEAGEKIGCSAGA
jgi:hypothetical protein